MSQKNDDFFTYIIGGIVFIFLSFCTNTIKFFFYTCILFFTFGSTVSIVSPLIAIPVAIGLMIAGIKYNTFDRIEVWILYNFAARVIYFLAQIAASFYAGISVGTIFDNENSTSGMNEFQVFAILIIVSINIYNLFSRHSRMSIKEYFDMNIIYH